MNVTRDEAAQALKDIGQASEKVVRLKGYTHGAPHFILWGCVWLVANTVTQFWPERAGYAWLGGVGFGIVASTLMGFMQSGARKPGGSAGFDVRLGRRIGITSAIMLGFIFCMMLIAQPDTSRQTNAMISIFFPFMYMAAGIWAGWRLFAIGLVTAAAILIGFYFVKDYFDLWMGVFAGGSLIAGGLWLRSA